MRTTHAHSAVDIRIGQKLPRHGSFGRPFRSISRSSDEPLLLKSQQMVTRHEQIRQSGNYEQAIAVLHHAAIADLGKAKDAFDDKEGMFNFGTHTRLSTVLLPLGEPPVAKSFLVGEVSRFWRGLGDGACS